MLEDFYIGQLANAQLDNPEVLIECKTFDQTMTNERIGKELLQRLEDIASLLIDAKHDTNLRTPQCLGYYLDKQGYSCGLVYRIPSVLSGKDFTTLRRILDDRGEEPVLGHRFSLAHSLAASLLRFHQASWLHRNISSFNILIIRPEGSSYQSKSLEPHLVSFLASRSDSKDIFTEGPSDDEVHQAYQHPAYLAGQGEVRYCAEFDTYSLGLVLLEIGLWKSIGNIRGPSKKTTEDVKFRKYIREHCLPRLGKRMGAIYQGVVESCLEGGLGNPSKPPDGDSAARQLEFYGSIVEPLAACKV